MISTDNSNKMVWNCGFRDSDWRVGKGDKNKVVVIRNAGLQLGPIARGKPDTTDKIDGHL